MRIESLLLVILLNVCVLYAQAADQSADELVALRIVVTPVLRHNEAATYPTGPDQIDLMERIAASRWRFDIEKAIRLLIESPVEEEQIAGWKLAGERVYPLNWSKEDIDKLLQKPDSVRHYGINSIAITDPVWLHYCLRSILTSSSMISDHKAAYWSNLSEIPNDSERIEFWLELARRPNWKSQCMETFGAVSESIEAINVMIRYLDQKSFIPVAYSMDMIGREQIRKVAVERLRQVRTHRHYVAQQIKERLIKITPDARDVMFVVAAAGTLYAMSPESKDADEIIFRWYLDFPQHRTSILQYSKRDFIGARKLEETVIATISEFEPEERFCICQWMMARDSNHVRKSLRNLMDDSHPGTRLAATIVLSSLDPSFNPAMRREVLFRQAVESPDDFARPFQSMEDAIAYLAMAGHSDEEARAWLDAKKTTFPQLEEQISDAAYEIEQSWQQSRDRNIFWTSLSHRNISWEEDPGVQKRARSPRPKPR